MTFFKNLFKCISVQEDNKLIIKISKLETNLINTIRQLDKLENHLHLLEMKLDIILNQK